MIDSLERNGFGIIPDVVPRADLQSLLDALGPVTGAGRRGLLNIPLVKQFAESRRIVDLIRPYLPCEPLAVRTIYFDKSPDANWLVPWHQDLTLAVRAQADVPGFGPWSNKEGVPHVQPPTELLEQMLTVRLHLDDCDENNGALRVLPGSHRGGKLSPEDIQDLRCEEPEFLCAVPAGGALLMRPLLLHASRRSQNNSHRRILHIEYAGFPLPEQLAWQESEA